MTEYEKRNINYYISYNSLHSGCTVGVMPTPSLYCCNFAKFANYNRYKKGCRQTSNGLCRLSSSIMCRHQSVPLGLWQCILTTDTFPNIILLISLYSSSTYQRSFCPKKLYLMGPYPPFSQQKSLLDCLQRRTPRYC